MIYLVSGYRRSGTSMMMRCLHEGGLPVIYQPGQEKIGAKEPQDFIPNPSGLLECGQYYYMRAPFLRMIPDGSLVKILYDGLPNLCAGDYKVVFMQRNPDEIEDSCRRVDEHLRQTGVQENAQAWYPFDSFRPYNQDDIDHVLGICEQRRDIELHKVWFRDVIDNPIGVLESLHLPIDVDKAAAVVNPEFYRYRNADTQDRHGRSCPNGEDRQSAA